MTLNASNSSKTTKKEQDLLLLALEGKKTPGKSLTSVYANCWLFSLVLVYVLVLVWSDLRCVEPNLTEQWAGWLIKLFLLILSSEILCFQKHEGLTVPRDKNVVDKTFAWCLLFLSRSLALLSHFFFFYFCILTLGTPTNAVGRTSLSVLIREPFKASGCAKWTKQPRAMGACKSSIFVVDVVVGVSVVVVDRSIDRSIALLKNSHGTTSYMRTAWHQQMSSRTSDKKKKITLQYEHDVGSK